MTNNKKTNTIKRFIKSKNKYYLFIINRHLSLAVGGIIALSLLVSINLLFLENTITLSNSIEFISIVSSAIVALLFYFKGAIIQNFNKRLMNTTYIGLLGYSTNIETFLKNERAVNSKDNYIVIDPNIKSHEEEKLLIEETGVIKDEACSVLMSDLLNYHTMSHIIISLGDDLSNVDATLTLIEAYQTKEEKDTPLRVIIEINDNSLKQSLYQNIVECNKKNKRIEIQTFSFYETVARTLFFNHDIEAPDSQLINTHSPFKMAVVGEGFLFKEIVYQIGLLAHLPNQNKLTLIVVHPNAKHLKAVLLKSFDGIEQLMNIETVVSHPDTQSFYELDLWLDPELKRVIICDEDEAFNVRVYTSLYEKTFLERAVHNQMTCEVFVALFEHHKIIQDSNMVSESFNGFHGFGLRENICTRENLIQDKQNLLARFINYSYGDEYNPNNILISSEKSQKEINNKWYHSATIYDRLSSQAQADHIKVKLKALNLEMQPYPCVGPLPDQKEVDQLLTHNRELFQTKLEIDRESLNLSDKFLHAYSLELNKLWSGEEFKIMYFPRDYDTLFEKLIRCEHNRWNAFHYLNGWKYAPQKDKKSKRHSCLKPLEEFVEPDLQITVLYDIYSILYIPNYLANIGYQLIDKELK